MPRNPHSREHNALEYVHTFSGPTLSFGPRDRLHIQIAIDEVIRNLRRPVLFFRFLLLTRHMYQGFAPIRCDTLASVIITSYGTPRLNATLNTYAVALRERPGSPATNLAGKPGLVRSGRLLYTVLESVTRAAVFMFWIAAFRSQRSLNHADPLIN